MVRQSFTQLFRVFWRHKSEVKSLKLPMFHAVTAMLSKQQFLSFSINYTFFHHSFGCAAEFLGQLMEIPKTSQTSIILGKSRKRRLEMSPRHIKSLEVLKYALHIPTGTETSDSC